MKNLDLTKVIATTVGISQEQAVVALEVCLDNIADVLLKGKKLNLKGFGVFSITKVAPKKKYSSTGMRPRFSGKKIKFKASSQLTDYING